MKFSLRQAAAQLLPPFLYKATAVAAHRLRGDATVFTGDYAAWSEAAAGAGGYEAGEILDKTRAAILRVKANPELFERDSVILAEPEYSFPALAAILLVAGRCGGRLDVVDFGGSLGSSYFQFRRFLTHLNPLRWAVVEQPHFVRCGSAEIAEGRLTFHADIAGALGTLRRDLLLASSVLQYLPDPAAFIQTLLGFGFEYILIDRTAFHQGARDRLTLQQNPPAVFAASYPAWFFNEEQFLAKFAPAYAVAYAFDGRDQVHLAGGRPYFRGFLLQRSTSRQ
jgi:putative methyltransferase (TIGR04325 family)